jgi:hypothetical protein
MIGMCANPPQPGQHLWAADGGFFAEEEQFSSVREVAGQLVQLQRHGGAVCRSDLCSEVLPGPGRDDGRASTSPATRLQGRLPLVFQISLTGRLYQPLGGDADTQRIHTEACPGKVDSYRFMTFSGDLENCNISSTTWSFNWLNGSGPYAG